jgi:hypothetical protein
MKDNVQSMVVQRNAKIMEKTMKKGRSRQVEASSNERDKKDDLTRTRSRNPMLAGGPSNQQHPSPRLGCP